ncbi:MAG: hypothetical protein M3Q66_01235 [Chloroflexota bacterium]|nr:hypothetical protein [Chloroflexota bacterium]
MGADEMADRVIDDALLTIDHTPQRRAMRVPWRFSAMSNSMKLVTAAAAIVVAVVATSWILGRGTGPGVGAVPSSTPSVAQVPSSSAPASPSPAPSQISTATWASFSSTLYGYRIGYPPGWTATPAERAWVFEIDRNVVQAPGSDQFVDKSVAIDAQVGVTAFALEVPAGTSEDEWITAYFTDNPGAACKNGVTIDRLEPTSVDGHAGRIARTNCSDSQAFVFNDGRVHVFSVWRTGQQEFFDAVLSTVRFDPPAASPQPSIGVSASPG